MSCSTSTWPAGAVARAYADGGAMRELLRERGRQRRGHHLQHHHGGAGVLQLARVARHRGSGFVALALHAVAAQRVHGLRRQAQVGADGNAALDQEAHGLGRPAAAFELDHVGAGLHQHGGAAQRLLFRFVVTAEGQVANQPGRGLRAAQAVGHALGVVAHGLQRHADGAGQALADHAQRVAHQDAFHTGRVGHGREGCVVGGQHGDFFAMRLHFAQARQAHGLRADGVDDGGSVP
jgi:hypothetical protein